MAKVLISNSIVSWRWYRILWLVFSSQLRKTIHLEVEKQMFAGSCGDRRTQNRCWTLGPVSPTVPSPCSWQISGGNSILWTGPLNSFKQLAGRPRFSLSLWVLDYFHLEIICMSERHFVEVNFALLQYHLASPLPSISQSPQEVDRARD